LGTQNLEKGKGKRKKEKLSGFYSGSFLFAGDCFQTFPTVNPDNKVDLFHRCQENLLDIIIQGRLVKKIS